MQQHTWSSSKMPAKPAAAKPRRVRFTLTCTALILGDKHAWGAKVLQNALRRHCKVHSAMLFYPSSSTSGQPHRIAIPCVSVPDDRQAVRGFMHIPAPRAHTPSAMNLYA